MESKSKAEQIARWVIDNRHQSVFNQISSNEIYNEVFLQVRNIEKQRNDLLEALIESNKFLQAMRDNGYSISNETLSKNNNAINKATQ